MSFVLGINPGLNSLKNKRPQNIEIIITRWHKNSNYSNTKFSNTHRYLERGVEIRLALGPTAPKFSRGP